MTLQVLLAGETWTALTVHVKGWDHFWSAEQERGAVPWVGALTQLGVEVTWMSAGEAAEQFPLRKEELASVDVVVLSDIGARSLLLHPDVWRRGQTVPNRLKMLRQWIEDGGGLVMCGGYMSFAGSGGSAAYAGTALEEVLPVVVERLDDRLECPEGVELSCSAPGHPLGSFFEDPWPPFLGYNRVRLRDGATQVAAIGEDPFVAELNVDRGHTLVWTSDIGPHWCPSPVMEDARFGRFWKAALEYVARS